MNPTVLTPAAKKANYFEQQTKHDQTIFTPMDVQFEVEVLTSPDGLFDNSLFKYFSTDLLN